MHRTRLIRESGPVLALALLLHALPGCGGSTPTEATKPIPIANPTPDNPNKDITLENEAGHMQELKAAPKPNAARPK